MGLLKLEKIYKHRLAMSFLLIIVLFLSFGVITTRGLLTLGDLTKTIHRHPLAVSNAALIAALNITKMHRSMKDVVLANMPDEIEIALKTIEKDEFKVYHQLNIIRDEIIGEKGQALEKETRQLFINWNPIREEVVRLLKSGNRNQSILITKGKGADHVLKLETKMLELTSYARKKADGFLQIAETNQSKLEIITIIFTIAGVLLSAAIAFVSMHIFRKSEKALQDEKSQLQKALDEIKTLHGIIPICAHCKQIRDDEGLWKKLEEYIHTHSEAEFSHSICPDCIKKHYSDLI